MVTDELTGLGNRRLGDQLLESLRDGDALILLDLDRFKSITTPTVMPRVIDY